MFDRSLNAAPPAPLFGREDGAPAGWAVSSGQVGYEAAVTAMEARAAAGTCGHSSQRWRPG